jgi:hypothetical protein
MAESFDLLSINSSKRLFCLMINVFELTRLLSSALNVNKLVCDLLAQLENNVTKRNKLPLDILIVLVKKYF